MTNLKKKAAGIASVVLVAAMLLTGTFAYVLNNQHRTDWLNLENRIYDLTLINNFTSYTKEAWNAGEDVANPIRVRSMSNTADETYTKAYVAVQLMEYINAAIRGNWLQVKDVLGTGTDTTEALFAIDENGEYMSYADAVTRFGTTNIVKYTVGAAEYAMINGSQKVADKNEALGIHGKPMRAPKDTYTYGNLPAYDGAKPVPSDECDATPIKSWNELFTDATKEARDYISFELGAGVMKLYDWQSKYAADRNDPALTGAFWIIDDTNPTTGWAYWAEPLEPGKSTTNLLENLTLEKSVDNLNYYMHVDMASASIDEIDVLKGAKSAKGCGMPNELVAFFKTQAGYNGLAADKEAALAGLIADSTSPVEAGATVEFINGVPMIVDPTGNVYVISENFPDDEVLDILLNGHTSVNGTMPAPDADGNEKLSPSEIGAITALDMAQVGPTLRDITGLEIFANLESLDLYGAALSTIDVSMFPNLTLLDVCNSNLTVLNLSSNPLLEELYATDNAIANLDISMTSIINPTFPMIANNGTTSLVINAAQQTAGIGNNTNQKTGNPGLAVTLAP